MKSKIVKFLILFILMTCGMLVDAAVKCDEGKPGDVVNCAVTNNGLISKISRIKVDNGLLFDSCDVCNGDSFEISPNVTANFKFKIDTNIKESKTLNVDIAGEISAIKVIVEEEENPEEVTYTVTLIPGKNKANSTKSCTVNSLNSTCNVTLDNIEDANFTGWGKEKDCTEGSKGNIKVNKDITYYACYKKESSAGNTGNDKEQQGNADLLLKSLIVKSGEEEIDLGFSIRIKTYNITVPISVETLEVIAVSQREDVDVVITGQDKLDQDENKISILLTDKDDVTNEYVINVKKSDEVPLPLLSNLIIGGYTIDFKPETFVYNVSIDSGIKELNIEPTTDNENYDIEVVGNSNLKNGSRINVVVTNLDNDATSTYVINIEQASSNLIIYIGIGAILLIVLIILLIIVVKKGKKNNVNKENKTNVPKQPGKPVSSKNNIPEVKPTIPVAPVSEISSTNNIPEKREDIEVLDF